MRYPVTTFYPKPQLFYLEEDYVVEVDGYQFWIPKGFIWDGSSIPSIFWWLMNPTSLGLGASAVHDWLYEHGGHIAILNDPRPAGMRWPFTRHDADRFLLHISKLENSWWWRRTYAVPMVRLFGKFGWNHAGHTEAELT